MSYGLDLGMLGWSTGRVLMKHIILQAALLIALLLLFSGTLRGSGSVG